jgi:hypothetical protein
LPECSSTRATTARERMIWMTIAIASTTAIAFAEIGIPLRHRCGPQIVPGTVCFTYPA